MAPRFRLSEAGALDAHLTRCVFAALGSDGPTPWLHKCCQRHQLPV